MESLTGPSTRDSSSPPASASSAPTSCARAGPQRSTRSPPAFVAIAPPTVAESRAAQSIPNCHPAAAACAWTAAIVAPAPATTVPSAATGASPDSRRVDSTTAPSTPAGTPPPTSPVLPPCGTTGTPAAAQAASTAATSPGAPGRTTARAVPRHRPVQSTSADARRSGSVSTCSAPTTEQRADSNTSRSCRSSPYHRPP